MKSMAVCESVYWKRGRGCLLEKGLLSGLIQYYKEKNENKIPHFEFTKFIDKRQFSDFYCSVIGMVWGIICVLQTCPRIELSAPV